METDRHYFMVGSFVLLTLFAIAGFSTWLIGNQDKDKYTPYVIRFAESVSGLDVGGPVKFRGVNVGKVDSIAIDPSDIRLIRVDISVLKETPIKTDTVASLKLQGITGSIYVELSGTTSQAENLVASSEDVIPEIPAKAGSIEAIIDILPEIMEKVSAIGDQINKALSDRNILTFTDMMQQLQKTSHDVSDLTRELKEDPSRVLNPPKEKGIPAP
jgi:phospholipid/cholesterol/gamma-HCH transport system substrate-binding protein